MNRNPTPEPALQAFSGSRPRRAMPARIHALAFALLGFLMPFGSGFTMITGWNVSTFFPVVLVFLIAYHVFRGEVRRLPGSSFFTAMVAFIVLHTILFYCLHGREVLFATPDPTNRFMLMHLAKVLLFPAITWVVAWGLLDPGRRLGFIYGYSAGLLVTLLAGVAGFYEPEVLIQLELRFSGGFQNPNSLAAASFSVVSLNAYLLLRREGNRRLNWFFLVVALLGQATSLSRAIMLCTVGAAMGLILFMPKGYRKLRPYIGAAMVGYVAVTFAFGALLFSIAEKVLAGYDEGQSFLERMNLGKRMHEGKELRLIIWGDYLKHYDRFLLTGVGAGRAMEVTRDDYSTDLHYNTHNKYLNMAVEFGILGFGLLLAALGAMAWKLLRRFLATRDLWSLCALCLLSAWLALLLLGDYTNSRDYWFYWGFLFFILQAGAGTQAPRPEAAP